MKTVSILLLLGLWGDAALAAEETSSLRCGSRFVRLGDRNLEVQKVCGAPHDVAVSIEVETIRERVSQDCGRSKRTRCGVSRERRREIPVEVWTYDFGPKRLVHHLTFRASRLVEIHLDGYGQQKEVE